MSVSVSTWVKLTVLVFRKDPVVQKFGSWLKYLEHTGSTRRCSVELEFIFGFTTKTKKLRLVSLTRPPSPGRKTRTCLFPQLWVFFAALKFT